MLLVAEDGGQVREDLVELVAVGACGEGGVLGAAQLDAATNCIARVICLMFRTAPMRRRMSRWLATCCSRAPAGRYARKVAR